MTPGRFSGKVPEKQLQIFATADLVSMLGVEN